MFTSLWQGWKRWDFNIMFVFKKTKTMRLKKLQSSRTKQVLYKIQCSIHISKLWIIAGSKDWFTSNKQKKGHFPCTCIHKYELIFSMFSAEENLPMRSLDYQGHCFWKDAVLCNFSMLWVSVHCLSFARMWEAGGDPSWHKKLGDWWATS